MTIMYNYQNSKSSMIDISVITPFYNGNKYMAGLLEMLDNNMRNMSDRLVTLEFILVNDSPGVEIEYNRLVRHTFDIRIFTNRKNLGIHATRCAGIRVARGKYIVMLDQDDKLDDNWMNEQWTAIQGKDFAISNALYCQKHMKIMAYKDGEEMHSCCNKWTMCLKGNKIISPGQALIKKDIIPKAWMKYQMKNNGADDYLLWIILFEQNYKVVFSPRVFYHHNYSHESVSHRRNLMRRSEREMVKLICKYRLVGLIRRSIYRARYKA